jgi:hypothetical protein
MSSAPPTDDVPPPKYQAQEPPPANGLSESKSVMSLAGPVTPYNPKDAKKQGVELNIGERESSWGYVIGHESVVEGEKRHERDYSFIHSQGYGAVSKLTRFDQGGTILKGKNTEVSRCFRGHMNPEKQYVIGSQSFTGDPEMLLDIIANMVKNHSRFTFTWDPTSRRPTPATEPELQERDIGDDIVSCSSAGKKNNRSMKARKGKGRERAPQLESKTQATSDEERRWKCVSKLFSAEKKPKKKR